MHETKPEQRSGLRSAGSCVTSVTSTPERALLQPCNEPSLICVKKLKHNGAGGESDARVQCSICHPYETPRALLSGNGRRVKETRKDEKCRSADCDGACEMGSMTTGKYSGTVVRPGSG